MLPDSHSLAAAPPGRKTEAQNSPNTELNFSGTGEAAGAVLELLAVGAELEVIGACIQGTKRKLQGVSLHWPKDGHSEAAQDSLVMKRPGYRRPEHGLRRLRACPTCVVQCGAGTLEPDGLMRDAVLQWRCGNRHAAGPSQHYSDSLA